MDFRDFMDTDQRYSRAIRHLQSRRARLTKVVKNNLNFQAKKPLKSMDFRGFLETGKSIFDAIKILVDLAY